MSVTLALDVVCKAVNKGVNSYLPNKISILLGYIVMGFGRLSVRILLKLCSSLFNVHSLFV